MCVAVSRSHVAPDFKMHVQHLRLQYGAVRCSSLQCVQNFDRVKASEKPAL